MGQFEILACASSRGSGNIKQPTEKRNAEDAVKYALGPGHDEPLGRCCPRPRIRLATSVMNS